MSNTRTPKSLRDRAARLQKEGGNQDLINKLLDDANAMEREGYEAGKKSGAYKAGGAVEDRLGDFAKKKVAESDARMKKMNPKSRSMKNVNPKGRKLDKNGNPIVTKEELEKSGMSLRDFLNEERGLTRRKDAPTKAAPKKAAPMTAPAVMANPMGDAARDKAVMNDEARKRVSAPFTKRELDGPSDAEVKRAKAMTAKAQEEKYGSGLKMGGKVKGYAPGGSIGKGYGKARGAKACKIR